MKKNKCLYTIISILLCIIHNLYGVPEDSISNKKRMVYRLKPSADIPVFIGCSVWATYMLLQLPNKSASTPEQVLSLNKNDINPLDRWATYPYNAGLDKFSYYPFYAAFPLPFIFSLTGNNMRNDFLKLSFLYGEALSVTGFFGTSATYFENKYRPYVYDAGASMAKRISPNAKSSFYAGHVEIVATSTFFVAEVYSSYYPDSKIKWLFFTTAGLATAGMGYLRIKAGMHFPSDVLLGASVGAASGILIPYFHNHKVSKPIDLTLLPFASNSISGLTMIYKLKYNTNKI